MKRCVGLLLSSCVLSVLYGVDVAQSTSSFIIQQSENKKKYSTNELKEKLGEATEAAFDSTTHVAENLGKLQVAVAEQPKAVELDSASIHGALGRVQQTVVHMQRVCSSTVKKLIDNEAPFKKARKPVLEKTLATLTSVRTDLSRVVQDLTMWCHKLKSKSPCFAELKRAVFDHEKAVNVTHESIKQDECLKHV